MRLDEKIHFHPDRWTIEMGDKAFVRFEIELDNEMMR